MFRNNHGSSSQTFKKHFPIYPKYSRGITLINIVVNKHYLPLLLLREMSADDKESWAQLVCTTDIDAPPALISKDKFSIGRNGNCDISHGGNKLVSGNHCYIERDHKGKVWLYDTSTNGTLLNLKVKLSRGECREINHGDEFHLVHKKDNTDEDIGYIFQDLKALEAETSSDLEETEEYDHTIADVNATLEDEDVNLTSTQCLAQVAAKRKKPDEEETKCSSKKSKPEEQCETFTAKCTTSTASSSKTDDSTAASTSKSNDPTNQDEPKPGSSGIELVHGKEMAKEPEEDALAETLICIICQELLHDCISLQPCMHSFCSGCYSEWMELSQECPSCRVKVDRINKNHIVNNLVEAYLKLNPDKRRPEEDIQALEAKNKITRDMLYPANQVTGSLQGSQTRYSDSDENSDEMNEDEEEDEFEEEEDDEEEEEEDREANANPYVLVNHYGIPIYGGVPIGPPAPPLCRQCPQYDPTRDMNAIYGQPGPSADPDAKKMPTPPDFVCQWQGRANHVLCLCCMQPMPDRRNQFNYRPDCPVPPQQCALCYRSFCHAYWGCRRPTCNGCLGKLKDMNFGKGCLLSLIANNPHESHIFKTYLEAKGLSVRDVLAVCLAKLVNREYTCRDEVRLTSLNGINTPVCFACGFKNFQELAYCYRRDIDKDELPAEVTARPDCHWGKNCRTQTSKPEHAKRFNHICEQTRIT
ncbi:hypothetical protein RRG08_020284 [Elysia crispata]|uniref:E3 ubiquitin-protein ligase CHFR n=1 Tax=Elysia crispata TaxID=231223 RepID=A0AAE1B7X1_9GAST|nr:hypothetical protein RRG08_020284 [Elysia crispata]